MTLQEQFEKETDEDIESTGVDNFAWAMYLKKYSEWLESKLQWIPCSERMPEENENDYLCFTSSKTTIIATWEDTMEDYPNRTFKFCNEYYSDQEITHWMQLPDKPE